MTYQDIINNIRDLGFSDDEEMAEFGDVVPNAINLAITKLNLSYAPIISKYEIELDDTDEGNLYLVMPEIDQNFLDFSDTPVMFERNDKDYYVSFSNYFIESGDTMVINADNARGSFRIFYKSAHTPFTGTEEQLSQACPLPLKAHHLVPLLAAYYVWLEDEPSKAAQYYNQFETEANEMVNNSESTIRVQVLNGGI